MSLKSTYVVCAEENGPIRMSIDYRPLNNVKVNNHYPMPHINDLFDQLLRTVPLTFQSKVVLMKYRPHI